MLKTHVIIVEEEYTFVKLRKMSNVLKSKFGHKILKINFEESENKMKVFLKVPVSLTTIERLNDICIQNSIRIRELKWEYNKGLNGGTGFCSMKIS